MKRAPSVDRERETLLNDPDAKLSTNRHSLTAANNPAACRAPLRHTFHLTAFNPIQLDGDFRRHARIILNQCHI